MKKYITLLFALLTFFIGINKVDAASLNLSGSTSTSSTTVGNSITVKFTYSSSNPLGAVVYSMTYDTSKLTLTSGTQNGAPVYTGSEKSASVTYTFKAKASGNAEISFKINESVDFSGNDMGTPSKTVSVNINTQAQQQASYSKNNNLSSLKISSGSLSPSFNKNTTSYSATVENEVTSITISGSREDNKSSVSGLGTFDLDEGSNKFNIKVTAQNGSSKTYTVTITRKELAPINVKTEDDKDLSVVRKREQLKAPNSYFTESTITLNEKDEIPAYEYNNNNVKITLVGLKDAEGNISYYRFEDNKYYPYNEIKTKAVILISKEIKDIPEGYKEKEVTINEVKYKAYQKDGSKKYVIYGMNLETGKEKLYEYDEEEKTLQALEIIKVDNKDKEIAEKRIQKRNYLIIGLALLLVFTYLGILIVLIRKVIKRNKKKKEQELKRLRELEEEELRKQKEREEQEEIRRKKELEAQKEKEKIEKLLEQGENKEKLEENKNKGKKKSTTTSRKKKTTQE
jgi:hypothetical protein